MAEEDQPRTGETGPASGFGLAGAVDLATSQTRFTTLELKRSWTNNGYEKDISTVHNTVIVNRAHDADGDPFAGRIDHPVGEHAERAHDRCDVVLEGGGAGGAGTVEPIVLFNSPELNAGTGNSVATK